MAKKKIKKGKKKKKEAGLSHLEREIYLLTINELRHKTNWRNHLCHIIEEDFRLCSEALDVQRRDEVAAAECLEEMIRENRRMSEKIKVAIPDAENSKFKAGGRHALDLVLTFERMDEEQLSRNRQLEVLRKKLRDLETYSVEKADEKIAAIEKQLQTNDDDDAVFLRGLQQAQRREEAFGKAMQDVLKQEADAFQDETSGKRDKNFARITEETRWWSDLVNDLRIATDRLVTLNDSKEGKLRTLRDREKATIGAAGQVFRDRRAIFQELVHQKKERERLQAMDARFRNQHSLADEMLEQLKQNANAQEEHFVESLQLMRGREIEIKALEEKLSFENSFGRQLFGFIERAQQLLAAEAKRSLLVLNNGPLPERKTLVELKILFEEATKLIDDKTVLDIGRPCLKELSP